MKGLGRCILVIYISLASCFGESPINSIRTVRELSRSAALKSPPIEMEATVLYSDSARNEAMIDDGTASCYMRMTKGLPVLAPGDRISLQGNVWQFGLFPHIESRACKVIGRVALPDPYRPRVDELFLPELDSDWVEIPAVVIGVDQGGFGYPLVVEVFGHEVRAILPMVPDADRLAAGLMQRKVRMTGVAATIFNNEMQMAGRHFFVPSFDHLVPLTDVIEPANAPLTTTLRLLTGNAGQETLVKLEGVVTQENENGFYLRDEAGSAYVRTSLMGSFPRGSKVAAVGFGHMNPYRPILRAASVIKTGTMPPPEPKWFSDARSNVSAAHDELVHLHAEFIGLRKGKNEDLLWCRLGVDFFEAIVAPRENQILTELVPGDMLELTGICKLTTSLPMPRAEWVDGFRLELAESGGIRVLRKAPWWTQRRLMTALGVTGVACVITMAGVILLRRQVAAQLKVIGDKLSVEAVHTERDRMARELHDTLEQQLAGVSLQIDGIARAANGNKEALESRVALARRMIRHTRAEARRSVWDLRSRILEKEGLVAALRELALGVSAASGAPSVELEVSGELPTLPQGTDFHMLRFAQEAVGNAVKHADARLVRMELTSSPEKVELSIKDDGKGFDVDARMNDPFHFGVIGMHQRAERIGATIHIASFPGKGCCVTLSLPTIAENISL